MGAALEHYRGSSREGGSVGWRGALSEARRSTCSSQPSLSSFHVTLIAPRLSVEPIIASIPGGAENRLFLFLRVGVRVDPPACMGAHDRYRLHGTFSCVKWGPPLVHTSLHSVTLQNIGEARIFFFY